jgi:hypothetical protein
MGNRNRNQADWNSRENRSERGRWGQGQEQNRFEQSSRHGEGQGDSGSRRYGQGEQYGRDFSSNQPYRGNYGEMSGRRESLSDEDYRRRRGYYGLQEGSDDWRRESSSDYGRQQGDWGEGNIRDFDQTDWGRNYGQSYGQDWSQSYEPNRQYYGQNYDRDRYQGSRFGREYEPQQRVSGEDWRTYSGGYGGGERSRSIANSGQGRQGSFDRDRGWSESRFGSRDWDRSDREDYGRGRDDESLGDKVGKFFGVGPKGWKRSDDRVRDDVSERLEQDPRIDASNIEIQVREAEVTLTGSVPDRWTKRLAEDVAENCRGVKDVHNQLRVQSEITTSTTGTSRAGVASESAVPGKRSVA